MTADTETIREALELVPRTWRNDSAVRAALAALGRVEERERALKEMLGMLYADYCIKTKPGGKPMPEWFERIIRELFPETLSSAAGSGEE